MKYIIDIDALKDCLDLLPTSYSSIYYVDLHDVKKLIDKFPKEEVSNNVNCINYGWDIETCGDCISYAWDMPQCKECDAGNNFKHFKRKCNDND